MMDHVHTQETPPTQEKSKQSKRKGRVGRILTPSLDATHTRDQATCPPKVPLLPNTRTEVIKKICSWSDSALSAKSHICWLYGSVGSGKSTVVQEIAGRFDKKKRLAGSFFFSRSSTQRKRVLRLAETLAYQLAVALPETTPLIEAVMADEPDLLSPSVSLTTQLDRLIYCPCKRALKKLALIRAMVKGPFLIVIDGIDQCEDKDQMMDLIDQAVKFFQENPSSPVRLLISGRVEEHMQLRAEVEEIQLINLDEYNSKVETDTFIRATFAQYNETVLEASQVTFSTTDIDALNNATNGSFTVASGFIDFILWSGSDSLTFMAPIERLQLSLGLGADLDAFFTHVLSRSKDLPHFSDIISTITLLKTPLSVSAMAKFLGVYNNEVVDVLASLSTIVNVPGKDDTTIYFLNDTLREYLMDEERSGPLHVQTSFLKSVAYRLLDTAIVSYEEMSEEQWMAPLSAVIQDAIVTWPIHLDLILEASPSFDFDGLDSRYTQILSRVQIIPLFSPVVAIIALFEEPVPLAHILTILQVPPPDIALILYGLTPILTRGPKKFTGPLSLTDDRCQFRHPSVRDFLLDPRRAKELQILSTTYTRLSQQYLNIIFGLPQTFTNSKFFFVSWAKFVALSVQHDRLFDLEWVDAPYNPVTPLRRAVDAAIGWKEPYTIELEQPEVALALSNVELAAHTIEARFPNAFEDLDNLPIFRDHNSNTQIAVSQKTVSVIDILEGFKNMLSSTENSYRLCLQRGFGVGIQVERYIRMSGSQRFVFSLYRYETQEVPRPPT